MTKDNLTERHDVRAVKVRDPLIGRCWTFECSWCGCVGRFKSATLAKAAGERHVELVTKKWVRA